MKKHVVIDGNAFYEIDEECMCALEKKYGRHSKKEKQETVQRKQGKGGAEKDPA